MAEPIIQSAQYGVIGLGAIGAFAVKQLAERGASVIGVDRFAPPHDQGSTHGDTRLIREAYSEDSRYIPILRRAITLWRELNKEMGKTVFHETGVNYLGPKDQPRILATRESAAQYDITLRNSHYAENAAQKPFHVPQDWDFFHETGAGYLLVEPVLQHVLSKAEQAGAILQTNQTVGSVTQEGDKWIIRGEAFEAKVETLIICAGAWAHEIVPALKPYISLERHTLHWFKSPAATHTRETGFRPFTVHTPDDDWFYGFPEDDNNLVKIAEHNEGRRFNSWSEIDRNISAHDISRVRAFKETFLPHLGDVQRSVSCMYTMTPDGHFIIDKEGLGDHALYVAGLSGHGYKFAPALAEAAIDILQNKAVPYDMSMFTLSRFSNL